MAVTKTKGAKPGAQKDLILRGVNRMKNNSSGTGIVAVIVFIVVLGFIGMAMEESESKCFKSGCDNEQASGSSYCYLHQPYSGRSSSRYSSSSSSEYGSSTSGSSKKYDYSSSNYSGKSKDYSSSSSSSKYHTQDSYDDGYEAVYDDEDYDMDRYLEDDDYASGVDDAIGDLEDEGESDW